MSASSRLKSCSKENVDFFAIFVIFISARFVENSPNLYVDLTYFGTWVIDGALTTVNFVKAALSIRFSMNQKRHSRMEMISKKFLSLVFLSICLVCAFSKKEGLVKTLKEPLFFGFLTERERVGCHK